MAALHINENGVRFNRFNNSTALVYSDQAAANPRHRCRPRAPPGKDRQPPAAVAQCQHSLSESAPGKGHNLGRRRHVIADARSSCTFGRNEPQVRRGRSQRMALYNKLHLVPPLLAAPDAVSTTSRGFASSCAIWRATPFGVEVVIGPVAIFWAENWGPPGLRRKWSEISSSNRSPASTGPSPRGATRCLPRTRARLSQQ
jgi:hypothetical protein